VRQEVRRCERLSREKKAQIIDALQREFSNCSIGILTDYRGLSNAEITELRRKVQASAGAYKVVKNTLARFAAERAERPELADSFEGPVAIAFGYGNVVQIARVVADHVRTSGTTVSIKAGFLPERILTAEEVNSLARLPSRDILLARAIGGMKGPIWGLVGVLAGPLRGLSGVLQARIEQLEGV
jgi:large subunit ribosomal protein L10